MPKEKRILVHVGMNDMPFPMRVSSRVEPDGQPTVGNISIRARISNEFEANWIDKFIQIVHQHRDKIGTRNLKANTLDYLRELNATSAEITYQHPFFIEKITPKSKEKCLVKYMCLQSAKASSLDEIPRTLFKIEVPVITTDPASAGEKDGGLFGQTSIVSVEVKADREIVPEDIVDIVDRHALSPVFSFLTSDDQMHIIQKIHTETKSSVVMTDEIKEDLARDPEISWFSVRCSNFGMLHSYSTVVATERSPWVPFSGYTEDSL